MKLRVWHLTTYAYDDLVTDSLGVGHLTPRELPWQHVATSEVRIEPTPGDLRLEPDYYGNLRTYYQVTTPHAELRVTATADVEVSPPVYDAGLLAQPWERCIPQERRELPDAWEAADFTLTSPQVERSALAWEYGAQSLAPGRPVGEAVTDLMHRLYVDLTYQAGVTTVASTVAEVWEKRAGVCQDFTHVALACLREHGLAARYVSGYLATEPPPGRDRVVGADATHAWPAVWIPGSDIWLAVDPTNDQWVDERYVTVGWGRDYGDVPPLKGVIFSDAQQSQLDVKVDVAPID